MKRVTRPDRKITIQLREFVKPKDGGQMELSKSKTITIHDTTDSDMEYFYSLLEGVAEGRKK